MKIVTTVKTLSLLGLMSLTLAAGTSQADSGYVYFGNAPAANPWLAGMGYQQANYYASMKARQTQLDQRQDAQMQRILGGMDDGRLTMREATDLLREHVAIAALERNYLADGRLGPNELRDLEQRLDEADRHIMFEKNDREQRGQPDRPGNWGRPGDIDRR